ncbi:RING finger protein 17 isoform X2 [Epargyreus clarus]|uniref:RING finger protein 17 isoform X2 n=1 Tax=Epargyreus clarus TaxID=520877 RepID=UPI003C2E7ACC
MDAKIKKCCPNCSQLYVLKALSPQVHGNVPLFLSCGHSMCESCLRNIVKFGEPIECKVCLKDMEITAPELALLLQNKIQLYQLFPVNVYMLGELTYELIEPPSDKAKKVDVDYFVEIQSILQDSEKIQAQCMECHGPTSKICKQCETTLCNNCFNKIHKNFVIFRNHTLQNIDSVITTSSCKAHKDKPLDYYCKDCSKAICMDCLVVGGEKSCKNHDVVSMQEMNESFLEELTDITPKVDETYRRLTKTAVEIGNLMYNMENDAGTSELTRIIHNIQQHFSKLSSMIQKHKKEVIDIVLKIQSTEKDSLNIVKNDIAKAIKEAKNTLNAVKSIDEKYLRQANLSSVLEEAKKVVGTPWYLNKDETVTDLKVKVNEDLIALLSDYIHLEGSANCKYKLLSTEELNEKKIDIPPPPPTVVHPPELPRDVRQKNKAQAEKIKDQKSGLCIQVPKYRSKSGSCSSLNSITSDSSNRSYEYGGRQHRPMVQQVSPFPDSQQPKQLYEGSQELIYISHIVDPHNFFVQRACLQPHVQELQREFRNAVSLPRPSVSHVAEGKFYLMFNKADNMWQRCRVMSIDRKDINNPRLHVFSIDFGSTEVVTIDKLRLLPPARVQVPHPFAINCSLANCEPKIGAWTTEDAILFQNIIDNKSAVIHIRRICSTADYTVKYECDLTTFDDGVSLAHALVFHERARMPNPRLSYPKFACGVEKPILYTSNNDFKPNTVEEVFITHVVSPDHFYVRKQHVQSVYEKLCEDLEQEYNINDNAGNIYLPEIGMVCAVNVPKAEGGAGGSGGWARGVVREAPGRGRVRAALPDTGALLLVHWRALRRLAPQFTTLRALAVECHLAGVTPLNKKWSPGSVNLLKLFENRLLELHVEDSRNRGSLGVTLYDKSAPENVICLNEQMIKHKYAVTFGIFMFNKNNDVNEQVITNKSPLEVPKNQTTKPQKETVKILKKNASPPKPKIKADDLEAKDKGPLRLEVKVLHYQSPSLFYVSLIHQQKTFNELFEKMQKYYSKRKDNSNEKSTWQVGDRCCTVCSQSQTWRRAAILEIDGDQAKVFYSDFACIETVPIVNLRELTKDFASIGDAAFKCHLCGVIPAVGDEWPSLTNEFLKELIDAYKRIFITKLGNFKDKSMPVELWVYHTVQGGALEPNTSEWRCLNKKIIDQGLGIPDKNQELSDTRKNNENADENMLSFLNMTGSVDEWLLLEQLPRKPLNETKYTKSDSEPNSHPSTPVDHDLEGKSEDTEKDTNTVFISDWLPPEPLPSNEFVGMPTYIDNDGIIYLHTVEQQDTLDLIRKALDVRFKNPDPRAKFAKWTVGEPCIALFFLDNRFYRGRVLEVDNEESTCLIHYIDYGNEETCSFVNLRKSIALYQIPTQAHKCALDRIRPIGKQWDRTSLDYIHKSIVEKQCFIKVSGPSVGGVIPVELKFDKLWINDHLVEFEMAVYTDGSKAVTRKFKSNKSKTTYEEALVVESDSGPDYILEEENSNTDESNESIDLESLKGKDWNQLLEEEEVKHTNKEFITFPKQNIDNFPCNITIINDTNTLELGILHSDDQLEPYTEMFENLQKDAVNMNALNGIYENKACIAIFSEDELWYRAIILEYSEIKNRIKVKFVDYGNIEILSPADIREISKEYTVLPPMTVSATLHGVKVNPDIELSVITQEYANTFLDKGPFQCKIVDYSGSTPQVELRNDNGDLVYEDLINKNIFHVIKY